MDRQTWGITIQWRSLIPLYFQYTGHIGQFFSRIGRPENTHGYQVSVQERAETAI